MDRISQTCLHSNASQGFFRIFSHFDVLFFATNAEDLVHFLFSVWSRAYNQKPVKKINRNSMGRSIVSPADFSDAYCNEAIPLFDAIMTIGAISSSRARFRNEKHSISSMWTSSMNRTPGMMSALPSSRHSATFVLIWSRTSCFISPVSPENKARKPCVLLLMTSTSWRVTVCTTSLRFCNSPSGHWTNLVFC